MINVEDYLLNIFPGRSSLNFEDGTPRKYFIDNEVLFTSSGVGFLIGGGHNVLRYVRSEIFPESQSIDNFWFNISLRDNICRQSGIKYLHVIFPDKQSVIPSEFPFSPVARLGSVYLKNEDNKVLYPFENLANLKNGGFNLLDTHLNDFGNLQLLNLILERFDFDCSEDLLFLKDCVDTEKRFQGDLAIKIDSRIYEVIKKLEPRWNFLRYRNNTKLNDGLIDLIFNPNAKNKKVLLIFGDSFFRSMLVHLSYFFEKVICCRTKYFHSEIVHLIQPDFVLTGNAERYLSSVSSDKEAHPFFLYPYIRKERVDTESDDFLSAWRAVLSPKSFFSERYFESKGFYF